MEIMADVEKKTRKKNRPRRAEQYRKALVVPLIWEMLQKCKRGWRCLVERLDSMSF